jgi:hypothetical protein
MPSSFDTPDSAVVDDKQRVTLPWLQWFSRVQRIVSAVQQSGPSDQRPTTLLWPGRTYFDTDLGIPIYVQQVLPAGAVWIDALGGPA